MRDIPMFETEYGIAGLVLNQVPYTGSAYIHILQAHDLQGLLNECLSFCRAVGAENVYACGSDALNCYPHYTDVLRMSRPIEGMEMSTDCLFPVTEESCEQWRMLYNEKMTGIDNAAILSERACKRLIKDGSAYFVHREGHLLGIGVASGEQIHAVVSLVPGEGAHILGALCHALSGQMVYVEVASTNLRAIHLYEKLGFLPNGLVKRWFCVQ